MAYDYDALLTSTTRDRGVMEEIAVRLRGRAGLRVLVDTLVDPFSETPRADALQRSATCVLGLGASDDPFWDNRSLLATLAQSVRAGAIRVVVLALPGSAPNALDSWRAISRRVDLRGGVEDAEGLERLCMEIEGRSPDEEPDESPSLDDTRALGTRLTGALPRAGEFHDRPELEQLRAFWRSMTPARVAAVVGMGGAGKTALVRRLLEEIPGAGLEAPDVTPRDDLPRPQGVFAWSFYHQPDIEVFFAALCEYLTGAPFRGERARVTSLRLLRRMERGGFRRVLLVLDGVEVLQEGQGSEGGFGLLRDTSMRHFVRRLARGVAGFHAVLTSRFPFPELAPLEAHGVMTVDADALGLPVARALLRSRGVWGDDTALDAIIQDFGRHALTLDHLGTLLANLVAGDVSRASSLLPHEPHDRSSATQAQESRLGHVMARYRASLSAPELAVIDTLCVAGAAVPVDVLLAMDARAHQTIERLRDRRLVFLSEDQGDTTASVHPAIRDCFREAHGDGVRALRAHVQQRLAPLLSAPRRSLAPVGARDLALLEDLVRYMVDGGEVAAALDVYIRRLRGYRHLGWRLGEYRRGARLTRYLVDALHDQLVFSEGCCPQYEHALFQLALGETRDVEARLAHLESRLLDPRTWPHSAMAKIYHPSQSRRYELEVLGSVRQARIDALVLLGRLPEASQLAQDLVGDVSEWRAINHLGLASGSNAPGRRGVIRALCGQTVEALDDLEVAEDLHRDSDPGTFVLPSRHTLLGMHRVWRARLLVRLGELDAARELLAGASELDRWTTAPLVAAQCALVLAEAELASGSAGRLPEGVEKALSWAMSTEHQETCVRARLVMARWHLASGDVERAEAEIVEARGVALACSFALLHVDALVMGASAARARGRLTEARAAAHAALDHCARLGGAYAWGIADARLVLGLE
jgi:hypothetical protein